MRPPVANIDLVFIVIAAANPDPDLVLLDKMLINASMMGTESIICINKYDITGKKKAEEIAKQYKGHKNIGGIRSERQRNKFNSKAYKRQNRMLCGAVGNGEIFSVKRNTSGTQFGGGRNIAKDKTRPPYYAACRACAFCWGVSRRYTGIFAAGAASYGA